MAKKKTPPTKFRIEVNGKDSISEGISPIAVANCEARGLDYEKDGDKWDDEMEKESAKLRKFVERFVQDGEGGSDYVTVEFDLEAKTCVVVPVKKTKRK